jgi:hypothetical protein
LILFSEISGNDYFSKKKRVSYLRIVGGRASSCGQEQGNARPGPQKRTQPHL